MTILVGLTILVFLRTLLYLINLLVDIFVLQLVIKKMVELMMMNNVPRNLSYFEVIG